MAKKGDELSTVLKIAFNFGDEIAFARGRTVKLEPEVSTTFENFASKISNKINDILSKVGGKGDDVSSESLKGVSKPKIGKTVEGITLEEVKPYVLKQIHY